MWPLKMTLEECIDICQLDENMSQGNDNKQVFSTAFYSDIETSVMIA